MAGRTVPLNESVSVTLNGAGNGTVSMRPDGPHETWYPTGTAAKVTTAGAVNPPEAVCRVYVGQSATDDNFVDATGSGSFGDSTGRVAGYVVGRHSQPYIWGVWTGGEPGAVATLTVTGTKVVYP